MTVHIGPTATAHEIAVLHRVVYWPGACPICHVGSDRGLVLKDEPGRGGRARYRCMRCDTVCEKRLDQVARVARRRQ